MGRASYYPVKRRLLLELIDEHWRTFGRAPTVRDLAEGIGVGVATCHSYLRRLADEGHIEWHERTHRSIRVIKHQEPQLPSELPPAPF